MPRYHKPRRGSRAFIRKRADGIRVRKRGLRLGEPTPLGFIGFKAGMTHAVVVPLDDKGEPKREDKTIMPITVIDAPPLVVLGLRAYTMTPYGKTVMRESRRLPDPNDVVERTAGKFYYTFDGDVKLEEREVDEERMKFLKKRPLKERTDTYLKDLERRIRYPKKEGKPARDEESFSKRLKELFELAHRVEELRLIVGTYPRLAHIKKVPDIFEIGIGIRPDATAEEVREIISNRAARVGSFLFPDEVLKPGEYVDAIGITKGHGFTGVIKRFGVKRLMHKSRKKVRGVGSLGPRHPNAIYRTVPMPGQYGYFRRVDYNKLVLAIGYDGEMFVEGEPGQPSAIKSITPAGGFKHYGIVRDGYILVKGSVPGPYKRTVVLRKAIRKRLKPEEKHYKILDLPLLPVKKEVGSV